MHGPGDDERSPPVDPDANADGDLTGAEASQRDEDSPPEAELAAEAQTEVEADVDAADAASEPADGENETPEAQGEPAPVKRERPEPKVAVGWGEKTKTKWQRPVRAEEERAPQPDVFDTTIRRSSRLHKDQVAAFASLTKDIFEMDEYKRAKLGLDPEIAAAFTACVTIKKGAKIRELRRISTMLRRFDGAELRVRVDDIRNKDRASSERSKSFERWRDRLLEEGDAALSEFVQTYPDADRQLIRQLVRTASRDRTQGKSRQAFRNLLREIRTLGDSADEAADETTDETTDA